MVTWFRNKRKSMGATSTTSTTASAPQQEKLPDAQKKSFLDFFRRTRRKRKQRHQAESEGANGADKATDEKKTPTATVAEGKAVAPLDTNKPENVDAAPAAASSPPPPPEHLTVADVQQLFSGAPHFSASLVKGRTQLSVSHPWDFELQTRDANDSTPLPHAAFAGATLRKHLPTKDAAGDATNPASSSLIYDIGVVEMPNMLASTGREPGTVGLEFFLQEPEADILNTHAEDEDPEEVFENFSNFSLLESQPEKLGIRKFDLTSVSERLVELSSLYASSECAPFSILNHASPSDLYAALFGKILTPPKYDGATTDPTGLKVQIEALLRILNLKRVWFNFSTVEWRIRVGQLLFTDPTAADLADSNLSEPEDGLSERDVVLLQLLLACELYVRLEAVAGLDAQKVTDEIKITRDEVMGFRQLESRKTKWDLVLARRFLESVDAKTYARPRMVPQTERSFARSLLGMQQRESSVKIEEVDIALEPRWQEQQLSGLFGFATALGWPDIPILREHFAEALAGNATELAPASPSIYATPLSTPGTLTPRSFRSTRESGYFAGANSPEMTPRSFQLQPPSKLDLLDISSSPSPDALPAGTATKQMSSIGGWLTRSYLTGLIMPGEPLSHLLISSLLENDAESIAALGENANLYGGFVYRERSFWSKSCVCGRVLACLPGGGECVGWVASKVVPDGFADGWVDVYSAPVTLKKIDVEGDEVAKKTALLGGREVGDVKVVELSLPRDKESFVEYPKLKFEGLRLRHNSAADALEEPTLSASLGFTLGDGEDLHDIRLANLVQFISAYPCSPPKTSASVTALKRFTSVGGTVSTTETTVDVAPSHPLHESYRYRQLHATELLDPELDTKGDEVLVVDARGDHILELLVRGWCTREGLNAMIARVGTTCLGCAVREASGVGVRVVVRVGEAV